MAENQILLEAIALKKCVMATYNRVKMKLAPYILYKRNDSFYVDAVALEKEGQPPREIKLGAFNLAGLNDVMLVDQYFEAEAFFDPAAPKYQGTTLFAIAE
jgi:hypothetical protein